MELVKINTTVNTPVTVCFEPVREVGPLALCTWDREVPIDMSGKIRAAFVMLKHIWASRGIKTATEIRHFNSIYQICSVVRF